MKKFFAVLLVGVMILTCFGCGRTDPGDDTQISDNVSNSSSNTDTTSKKAVGDCVINISKVKLPAESEERLSVEKEAGLAVNEYIAARACLDEFLDYDIESGNLEEYSELLNNAVVAFESMEEVASSLERNAASLEEKEIASAQISIEDIDLSFLNPFVLNACAEESEAVKWAKDITERFDKAPVGKGIRTLAEQMGTDAKHAYAQLKQAQDILAGNAYEDFAQTANTAYKTAKVLKTAGTAAQFTLSIVTANPVTTTGAVMTAGGIVVNGLNTMFEVGQTGSILWVGDDNKLSKSLENVENVLAPIGSVIGLYGCASNLAKGAELLDDGAGMADTLMYLGTSIYDYATEGKILGGSFTQGKDGGIECTICETMTLKSGWAKDPKVAEEILMTVGYTEEEIAVVKETAELSEGSLSVGNEEALTGTGNSGTDENGNETVNETGNEEVTESGSNETGNEDYAGEAGEGALGNPGGSIPSIDDIAGYYPFYLYYKIGDSTSGMDAPQTVTLEGGNNIVMTDVDGYGLVGTYDSSTGVATLKDTDGSVVKVTFSYDGGKVHATLKMGSDEDFASVSGSGTKQ